MVQFYQPKKQVSAKNPKTKQVAIDGCSVHGEGVVSSHKPPLFVQGGLPGETLSVQVTQQKASGWHGRAGKLIEPATAHGSRQQPFCRWVAQCGGCSTQHCQPEIMLSLKQQAYELRFTKALSLQSLPWCNPIVCDETHYRRKARLAYDARNPAKIKLGFKAAHSNKTVSIPRCPILVAPLQAIMQALNDALVNSAQQPIGHITLMAFENGCSVSVNFVREPNKKQRLFWQTLHKKVNAEGARVDVNLHVKKLLLEQYSAPAAELLRMNAPCSANYLYPDANDFVQVNQLVNEAMVRQALTWLDLRPNDTVLECFSGLGNFTYALAEAAYQVDAIEGVDTMVQKAKLFGQKQGINNANWQCADLSCSQQIATVLAKDYNSVLLDPSREGAETLCMALGQSEHAQLNKVVYVSCNPQTWLRDAKHLIASKFKLEKLALMDMFPYTPHTEIMSLFTHK